VIGQGSKIDNLVMIAHNCEVGRHNLLAALVGFAGSVTTGDYVVCAGQVGIADHVHLGSQTILAAQSGVPKSLAGNTTYLGSPALPDHEQHRQYVAIRKLPRMREQLNELAADVKEIQLQIQAMMDESGRSDGDCSASAA
jgi:UDP-3-O-[3-hydroxymyristoyl] glucosamine N-acyltransferase